MFKTKQQKFIVIGIAAVILLILIWWIWAKNKASESLKTEKSTEKQPEQLKQAALTVAEKISNKIDQIRNNSEWFNKINSQYSAQGYTLNQALAINAIWALKVDGEIDMNYGGAGEFGHIEYVKQNY